MGEPEARDIRENDTLYTFLGLHTLATWCDYDENRKEKISRLVWVSYIIPSAFPRNHCVQGIFTPATTIGPTIRPSVDVEDASKNLVNYCNKTSL